VTVHTAAATTLAGELMSEFLGDVTGLIRAGELGPQKRYKLLREHIFSGRREDNRIGVTPRPHEPLPARWPAASHLVTHGRHEAAADQEAIVANPERLVRGRAAWVYSIRIVLSVARNMSLAAVYLFCGQLAAR